MVDDSGAKSSLPEDSSSSDCFSSLDEGDAGDFNSPAMQQEGINSDTYDLDDLMEHSTDGTKLEGFTQRSKSPPQGMCSYMYHNCIYN